MSKRLGRATALILVAGGLTSVASAQTDVIVPSSLVATNGTGGLNTVVRDAGNPRSYQVIYAASELTSVVGQQITALTWRSFSTQATFPTVALDYADYEIRIATSVNSPANMSTTFSANLGGDVVIVRDGPLTIPVGNFPGTPGTPPFAFGGFITFQTPFVYTGGDLVVDVRHPGATAGTTGFLDGLITTSTAQGYGTTTKAMSFTGNVPTVGTFTTAFATKLHFEPGAAATGACCKADGSCIISTSAGCAAASGTYAGNNVTCAAANCPQPPTGACCAPLGTCSVLTQANCVASGGTYAGNNVTCVAANCPQPPAAGDVYAIDNRNAAHPFLKFPVNSPAYTQVGTVTPTCFAIDFNGDASTLYVITNNATVALQELGTLNQSTGAYTTIALISGAGAAEANWGGLAFDKSTNTMYALATAVDLNRLYTINLGTGVTTLVAPITGLPTGSIMIDFSINDAGTLMVGHEIGSDQMFSINKTTGVATALGSTGFAANFAQGMDFDPTSGKLYAAIYVGSGVGAFVQVNTTTGACTTLASTTTWAAGVGAEMEMAIKGVAVGCYANCDGSTSSPVLTANDFQCFLNEYAANHSYANCDGSTNPPTLTANDFQCFLNAYAAGCS